MDKTNPLFGAASDRDVTVATVRLWARTLEAACAADAVVVGGGPSGLVAAAELARAGQRTVLVERNNYLGGGMNVGGFGSSHVTLRSPAHQMLAELGVPLEPAGEGLFGAPAAHCVAALSVAACQAGVTVLALTGFEDVMVRDDGRVAGVVVNHGAVRHLPPEVRAVDPLCLGAPAVIDATGHEAVVVGALERRGLVRRAGEGGMWAEVSEEEVVERTGAAHPGLWVCGMAVAATFGLHRMGPTFGAMLLSGRRVGRAVAAEEAGS